MNESRQPAGNRDSRFPKPRIEDLAAILLVVAFAAASSFGLDAVPPVHVDEGWTAAPGYTLATSGRFATELFRGYFGADRHWYGFLPVFPAIVGTFLRLFGLGLLQARAASVFLASVTLLLTYLLGRRLLSPTSGLLATLILATWPIAAAEPFLRSGIPLADLGRIVRYDVAVPVFGLAALLVVATPFASGSLPATGRCLIAGGLTGLATLSHAYGGAFLPALAAASVWSFGRRGLRSWPALAAGWLITAAPWALFVLSNPGDFRGQNFSYAGRFQLFRPGFYLENLLAERGRYGPVLEALRSLSPAAILFVLTTVTGFVLLLRRAVRSKDRPARLLVGAAAVLGTAFAVALRPKMFWYLGTIWPLMALAASSTLSGLLEQKRSTGVRVATWAVIAVATSQGFAAALRVGREARASTPYHTVAAALRARVPSDGRLLLQPHWFLALGDRPGQMRCIFVPILLAHPAWARPTTPLEETLRLDPPDLVLMDRETRAFLGEKVPAGDPGLEIRRALSTYISGHSTGSEVVLEDPWYGRIEVVRLSTPAGPEWTGLDAAPTNAGRGSAGTEHPR